MPLFLFIKNQAKMKSESSEWKSKYTLTLRIKREQVWHVWKKKKSLYFI